METQRETPPSCPICNSESVEYREEQSSWVCSQCSLVTDALDRGSEIERKEKSLTTKGKNSKDTNAWQNAISIKDRSEENLVDILTQVEQAAEELPLSEDVVIQAGEILSTAWESNFMHGRSKEDTTSAALYVATRESACTVPIGAIAKSVGGEEESIKRTYRQLKSNQGLELDSPSPEEFVEFLRIRLDLSSTVGTETEELLEEHEFVGGNPLGTAGAGIYEVAKNHSEKLTLRQIANASTLTKETIWRHKKKLCLA